MPFRHRWIIQGFEVDFVIFGNVCIEIDGHEQNEKKNEVLAQAGYVPIHLHNSEVTKENITSLIQQLNGTNTIS